MAPLFMTKTKEVELISVNDNKVIAKYQTIKDAACGNKTPQSYIKMICEGKEPTFKKQGVRYRYSQIG